jgi:hypothetical protein
MGRTAFHHLEKPSCLQNPIRSNQGSGRIKIWLMTGIPEYSGPDMSGLFPSQGISQIKI